MGGLGAPWLGDYGLGGGGASPAGGSGSSWFTPANIFSGLGGIGEIIGSLMQNSAYQNVLGGLTQNLNSIIGPEVGYGTSMLKNWQTQVAPELQSVYGSQTGLGQQSYGTAGTYAGGAAGAAGALQRNPYIGAASPIIGGLLNYKAFTPQEQAALTTGAGEAASSAASTFAAESGGVPNAALLEKQLATSAGTTSSQTAVQLGSIASQQHLQAMESALQGTLAQGSEYTSAESAAGGIYSGLSQEYAGLSESEFTNALDSLGIQSSELSTGASLLGQAGGDITNILDQVYGGAQQSGGGWGGMLGGLTSLAGLFGV